MWIETPAAPILQIVMWLVAIVCRDYGEGTVTFTSLETTLSTLEVVTDVTT